MRPSARLFPLVAGLSFLLLGAVAIAAGPMPALRNLSQPEPGIYAAGAVSPADVDALSRAGIRHVINLRPASETPGFDEAAAMQEAGIDYLALPIAGAGDLDLANVRKLDAALKAQAGEPSLLHCASSNRVGALMALRAGWIQGLPADEAIEIGRRWGLASLEDEVRQRLAMSPR